ncbi:MAG TPA: winged helix-turn-helix domain-containing protein [Bryobacteraceae bacterium]|nr:winged helix-turn-helix domain-containing protein [Bryobacteraceae bacterium]
MRKHGIRVKLQEKPFQLLVLLLDRAGQVVTREELRQKLWPADTFVDFDHSLGTAMGKLRLALGDSHGRPRYIETVPKRGYKFIAQVTSGEAIVSHGSAGTTIPDERAAENARSQNAPPRPRVKLPAAVWLGVTAVALALAGATVPAVRDRILKTGGAPRIRSIAVLPFENLSHDPEQDYFADGVTDELITSLARIPALRVISRTSSMYYKGKHLPLARIARELNVDGVLEGTLRRSGNRVRLTAQLIHTPEERHIWAQTYEHDAGDLLTLQAVLAEAITNEIKVTAAPQAEPIVPQQRINPEAYEDYLRARYFWNRSSAGDMQRAMDLFEQAAHKAPDYAPAYTGSADCYFELANDHLLPANEGYAKSKGSALKALAINANLSEAHIALARVLFQREWNWRGAEREFHRGIELSPSSPRARVYYASFLMAMGRSEEAVMEGKRACTLDPVAHSTSRSLGDLFYLSHKFDEAVAAWRRTLELYPDSGSEHLSIARVFWKQGLEREAREELLKAEELWGADGETLAIYRRAYAVGGMRGVWKKELELAHYERPYEFALLHAQIGDRDGAFRWLEKAVADREARIVFLKMTPLLDELHSDPRFQNLIRQVGLPI